MKCPICAEILQKISITTTSSGLFEVEHCGRCGGTWFDPYEINRIPYHEVVRLAKLTVIPKKIPVVQGKMLCPRCHKQLEKFESQAVPANVRLFWCRKCLGIWASQKDIWEFKKNQEKTIDSYRTDEEKIFPHLSVVFIPAISVVMLLLTTFVTISRLQQMQENRSLATQLISNRQIVRISPSIISIIFNTSVPVKSSISYGLSSLDMETITVEDALSTDHNVILTDLLPGKTYLYTLSFEDETGRKLTTSLSNLTIK